MKRGDTVAVVSSSCGGPSVFPHVYELGTKRLEEVFGLKVREYPSARIDAVFLYENPQFRAKDINDAFADKEVKAIFASIGGDDSIRILPFLDKDIIQNNPKIFMGYSDTTTLLTYINQLGLVTFNGPSVMAGFAEQGALKVDFVSHIKEILFDVGESYEYKPYEEWTEHMLDWSNPENLANYRKYNKSDGWKFVQGESVVQGELFGGCIEVLEFMKGTDFWPTKDFWNGKILFLETSEDKPSVNNVKHMLRNYGMQGVFGRINGLIFARARDYSLEEKKQLDEAIISIVAKEFGRADLPIVTNFDFGHTDPQLVMPLGVKAEIDCVNKKVRLVESWVE